MTDKTNKDNLPQFLCNSCFKETGLEESLTMGSFLPRDCMICGETVPKGDDYDWVWKDNLQQFSEQRERQIAEYTESVESHWKKNQLAHNLKEEKFLK